MGNSHVCNVDQLGISWGTYHHKEYGFTMGSDPLMELLHPGRTPAYYLLDHYMVLIGQFFLLVLIGLISILFYHLL